MRAGLSRRALGGLLGSGLLGSGLLGAGVLQGRAFASPTARSDRKFLFVFCEGGFDPTWVFAPMLDVASVHTDTDVGAELREQGGLRWVHNDRRGQVSTFLQDNAHRTCFINGFEVRSVTHEACRRIIMTGGTGSTLDDWPSRIAAASPSALLPSLVLSGPSYTYDNGSAVIRVGESGQLARLISGEALADGDLGVGLPSSAAQAEIEALLRRRIEARMGGSSTSQARFAEAMRSGIDQLGLVQGIEGLDLSVDADGWVFASDRVEAALMALELGLSRCITVEHKGEWDIGWDTHSGLSRQENNYIVLFEDLAAIMAALDSRVGLSGAPLSEEVTVVVFSEMGRAPGLNTTGGKDHWTFTSAMLIGAGVAGGKVIGAYDDSFIGRPIDLSTGEADEHGTPLTSQHLGATLLELAGIDPLAELGIPAIQAAISS